MRIVVNNLTTDFECENRNDLNRFESLFDAITAEVPGAKYTWDFKQGGWDGRILLCEQDNRTFTIETGLAPRVIRTLNGKVSATVVDNRGAGTPTRQPTQITLRDYQLAGVMTALGNTTPALGWWPRGVIKVATGGGKTEMAVALYEMNPVPTMFLVHRKDLLVQAAERFAKYGHTVGRIGDSKFDPDSDVTIATMQTLHKITGDPLNSRYEETMKLIKNTKQLFFDECFHPSHELLTTDGWKSVGDISHTDQVAQVNQNTGVLSYAIPEKVIRKEFTGQLVQVKGRTTDLLVTPNHQHLIYRNEVPEKVTFDKFVPTSKVYQRRTVETDGSEGSLSDLERLHIAYQADGTHIYTSKLGVNTVRFSFRKQRKVRRLLKIVQSLGLRFSKEINSRGDTNISVWLDGPVSKTLNWMPLDRSKAYYRDFLDEVVAWDGNRKPPASFEYNSCLKVCAEAVHTATILGGYASSLNSYTKHNKNHNTLFRVVWREASCFLSTRRMTKTQVPYSGYVYCVRVPEGNVLTRRNGKVSVTGNCHLMASSLEKGNLFVDIASYFENAVCRWGLTATPFMRGNYDNMLLESVTGEILYEISNQELIDRGYLTPPKIRVIEVPGKTEVPRPKKSKGPGDYWRLVSDKCIVSHVKRNELIAKEILKGEGPMLCLVSTVKQAENVQAAIKKLGGAVPMLLSGKDKTETRRQAVRDLQSGKVRAVICTTIWDEGLDVPNLRKIILASGGKSQVKLLQRIGRGLRLAEGKKIVEIVDFDDRHHAMVRKHALERLKRYKVEGFDVSHH